MKISKQDFLKMQEKYKKEVKKGKPGKTKKGDVTDQTDWIFFDRETLEAVLDEADQDPKKGGIKFYFTEYTQETANEFHPENPEAYVGRITLVLQASTADATNLSLEVNGANYYNKGEICPPVCQ